MSSRTSSVPSWRHCRVTPRLRGHQEPQVQRELPGYEESTVLTEQIVELNKESCKARPTVAYVSE